MEKIIGLDDASMVIDYVNWLKDREVLIEGNVIKL